MATAITCISVPPTLNPLIPLTPTTKLLRTPKPFFRPISITQFTNPPLLSSTTTSATTSAVGDGLQSSEEPISIDNLRGFIQLNLGKWNGSFNQFDCYGNLVHQISTKLSASSYGDDELLSLSQSLYIKQPPLYNAKEEDEQEWYEYKIKETNMFTVDKYQQIGFFPKEKAFALRYQMAGMLESVLRQGVLGEDDTGEESPKNLKLPSRRPALVCENCLYSLEKDMRVRAFHVMDPQGTLEMLYIFLEERDSTKLDHKFEGDEDRITPHLGTWKGHSITKRSGVYGATISQANTTSILEIDKNGKLIQDVSTTIEGKDVTTNVHWTGTTTKNLITFDKGYQMTLLPLGIYMGCPCDLTKSVQESKSFHLELCWLESGNKRQRLVRTFDLEGLAVSSTYFFETKI